MKLIVVLMFVVVLPVYASLVAVVDSGVDTSHQDLLPKIWTNSIDSVENGIDDDQNGYMDDIFGWNFVDNNNLVFDRSHVNKVTDDLKKFMILYSKYQLGTVTSDEISWLREKINDNELMGLIGSYGGYAHGTHVAGILSKNSSNSILSVKFLKSGFSSIFGLHVNKNDVEVSEKDPRVELDEAARGSVDRSIVMAEYINGHNADVANGSYGTSYEQVFGFILEQIKELYGEDATEDMAHELTRHYFSRWIEYSSEFVETAGNTLFVFAAGNESSNNDEFPCTPANIDAANVITVAASKGRGDLAKFSNYGVSKVHIAAPGVAISSSVPSAEENLLLPMSGTSQAAPFVSNVAGRVKDANSMLNPGDIKQILMETVDVKEFLKGKVMSGGIVNSERALYAAKLSKDMGINEAVAMSKTAVKDIVSEEEKVLPNFVKIKNIVRSLPSPDFK